VDRAAGGGGGGGGSARYRLSLTTDDYPFKYTWDEGGDGTVRADLHGKTLSHATSLRQAYDKNCFV